MNTQELLESKNIYYKTSGADLVVHCLNPEHEDNNPSMRIDQLTGTFNCLSCGFSGNIFKHYDITRNELDIRVVQIKNKIRAMMVEKLSIPLGAEPFNKDYRVLSASTYKQFEAFTYSADSELEDRIIFPVRDIGGDITSFQARRLFSNVKPKYLNYPKGRTKGFYPAHPEAYLGSVILVEGIFDFLNLYDKGITNAVSSLGLMQVSKKQDGAEVILEKFSLLKLQGIHSIFIMYDGDKAGNDAAYRLEKVLKTQFTVEIIELPEGMDPGSMSKDQIEELRDQIYESSNN